VSDRSIHAQRGRETDRTFTVARCEEKEEKGNIGSREWSCILRERERQSESRPLSVRICAHDLLSS